jgi:hypothetical protein
MITPPLLRRLRPSSSEDGGYALLVVLGVGVMLLALVTTALTVASSGYRKAGKDDDWNAALSAAYGGLEEYQSRLANDSTYAKYGNPSSPFTAATDSTVSLPSGGNPAFGVGAAGTWAQIPGSDGKASYRYEVDNSAYSATGTLRLRVTGRVDGQTRTVVADLRQSGFIDYLYFTDFEVADPDYATTTPSRDPLCKRHAWDDPTRPAGCKIIQFGAMDTINGPVHSNDQLVLCGGTFKGAVTTSNPNAVYSRPSGCPSASFTVGTGPTFASSLDLPATNGEMRTETQNDLPDVPRPGCLYTGPTSITFNPNGTMTVVSPWTKYTNRSFSPGVASANPAACGQPGTGAGQLGSAGGATVPVLDENLLYVQDVPRDSTDPNSWPTTGPQALPADFSLVAATPISSTNPQEKTPAGWKFHSTRYPLAGSGGVDGEGTPKGTNPSNLAYGPYNGDLFVQGTVNGATTVAAENFVYVIGDLRYADVADDVLGLVGNNSVWVWNPIRPNGSLINTSANRTIHAAIISVEHTFTVQNYENGPNRGTLTVLGAIAQRFRGPVATTSGGSIVSGYAKSYSYDTRLRYTAPPKFLTPVSTTYGVTQVAGVPTAFTADGAVR